MIEIPSFSEPLLSVAEVAGWLNVSRDVVYRLTCTGDLPFMRAGRELRFDPDEVRAYRAGVRQRVPKAGNAS